MATAFCFASTGNSLYTVRKTARIIHAEILPMTYDETKTDDDVIGFGGAHL